jgi:NAD+ synthase
LVKGQVREVAYLLNIPEVIVNKAPTAGLWPGQTDEADMGFSYIDLDNYLLNGKLENSVTATKIEDMKCISQHKRRLPLTPPGI